MDTNTLIEIMRSSGMIKPELYEILSKVNGTNIRDNDSSSSPFGIGIDKNVNALATLINSMTNNNNYSRALLDMLISTASNNKPTTSHNASLNTDNNINNNPTQTFDISKLLSMLNMSGQSQSDIIQSITSILSSNNQSEDANNIINTLYGSTNQNNAVMSMITNLLNANHQQNSNVNRQIYELMHNQSKS